MMSGDVGDRSSEAPRMWFTSTDEPHAAGDLLRKEDQAGGYCLYAVTNLSAALDTFGFDRAVYRVVGDPCPHKWADNGVLLQRQARGGYREWWLDEEDEVDPVGDSYFFDELRIVEIIADSFFGKNGF